MLEESNEEQFIILGVNLTRFTSSIQFIICVIGVFLSYGLYAVFQEKIFSYPKFDHGVFLTLFQFFIYTVVCKIEITAQHGSNIKRAAPISSYALIGFISLATVALSNLACQYLPYPMQVLLKSCKLLPVMIVGAIYFRKSYSRAEVIAIILLSLGVIMCSSGSKSKLDSLESDWRLYFGLLIMAGALTADAIIGNVQEKVMKEYKASSSELILYSKFCGLFYVIIVLLGTNKMLDSIYYVYENKSIIIYMTLFSITGCIGEHFVMPLIKKWGALIAVVITSLRKILTVILSFIIFPKPLTFKFFIGMLLVFGGMFLEVYAKNSKAINQKFDVLLQYIIKYNHCIPNKVLYYILPSSYNEDIKEHEEIVLLNRQSSANNAGKLPGKDNSRSISRQSSVNYGRNNENIRSRNVHNEELDNNMIYSLPSLPGLSGVALTRENSGSNGNPISTPLFGPVRPYINLEK